MLPYPDNILVVIIDYTNWKGERAERKIKPQNISFTRTEHHSDTAQWILRAWDIEKDAWRDFAMKDIHSWRAA